MSTPMLAYPKNVSFWQAHKLHVGVAVLVLILHAALLYALWRARAVSMPGTEPVFARLINDPSSAAPVSVPVSASVKPAHTQSVMRHGSARIPAISSMPMLAATPTSPETIAPAADVDPHSEVQTGPKESISSPVRVASDVSLACPVRTAPVYPLVARKLGEAGTVLLRVELDENGRLVANDVARSSGFSRLDEAAVAAVKRWRCQPAMRDGQALRIVSIESFDFKLGD